MLLETEEIRKFLKEKIERIERVNKEFIEERFPEFFEYVSDKKEKPKVVLNEGKLLLILRDIRLNKNLTHSYEPFFIIFYKGVIYTNGEFEKEETLEKLLENLSLKMVDEIEKFVEFLSKEIENFILKNKEEIKLNDLDKILRLMNVIDFLLISIEDGLVLFEKLKIKKIVNEIEEIKEELSFLDEKLNNLLNIFSLYYNLKNSKLLDKISIIGFLFLIPSTVFGMYGMNFKYIPLADHPYGFIIVSTLSFLIVGVLYWLLIKKLST